MSKIDDYRRDYKVGRDSDGILEHVCFQMELLAARKVTLAEAKEQTSLAKQANNVLRLQLDVKKFEQAPKK